MLLSGFPRRHGRSALNPYNEVEKQAPCELTASTRNIIFQKFLSAAKLQPLLLDYYSIFGCVIVVCLSRIFSTQLILSKSKSLSEYNYISLKCTRVRKSKDEIPLSDSSLDLFTKYYFRSDKNFLITNSCAAIVLHHLCIKLK